jgi:hypothetical protein
MLCRKLCSKMRTATPISGQPDDGRSNRSGHGLLQNNQTMASQERGTISGGILQSVRILSLNITSHSAGTRTTGMMHNRNKTINIK